MGFRHRWTKDRCRHRWANRGSQDRIRHRLDNRGTKDRRTDIVINVIFIVISNLGSLRPTSR